jgi:uncharacterized protein with HEPN domain
MTRDYTIYLSDIIENMTQAVSFIGPMSFDEFTADRKTAYAVIRCFEIIGEATKNIPAAIQEMRPDIPWSDMARMRDKCIHAYWGINHKIVWSAVKDELPVFQPKIQLFLAELKRAV